MLTVLLLAGVFSLLSVSVRSWRAGSGRTELQQTARYAMDSMIRDLRFGSNYTLENDMSITYINQKEDDTTKGNTFRYYVDSGSHILYRQNVTTGTPQPVTGDNVANSNTILVNAGGQVLFALSDANTVVITLTVSDSVTGQTMALRSAVTSISQLVK